MCVVLNLLYGGFYLISKSAVYSFDIFSCVLVCTRVGPATANHSLPGIHATLPAEHGLWVLQRPQIQHVGFSC